MLKSIFSMEEGAPEASVKQSSELTEWLNNFKGNTASSSSSSSPSSSSSSSSDTVSSARASLSSLFSAVSSSLSFASSSSSSSSSSALLAPSPSAASSGTSLLPDPSAPKTRAGDSWWPWRGSSDESGGLLIDGSSSASSSSSTSSSSPSSSSYFSFATLSSSASPSAWLGLSGDSDPLLFGLSAHQRLMLFFMAAISGLFFLFLSASFLSLLVLGTSAKFTLSYAMAQLSFLFAACLLTGPSAQASLAFHSSRWMITVAYLSSLFALVYVASNMPSLLLLLPILLLQIAALFAYLASYVPFGLPALTRLFNLFVGLAKRSC